MKQATERVNRQKRRASKTREKLIDAARIVFAEKGIDLTTIDDITEKADVGKGTFYYHFKNKELLIRELIRQVMHELVASITSEIGSARKLEKVLDRIILAHVKFFSDKWEDFTLYYQSRADLILEEGYEGLESPFEEYLGCIENHIDNSLKQRVSPRVLRRIACAVAGLVSGYYAFVLVEAEADEIEKVMRTVRGALVAGLIEFTEESVS